MSRKNTTSGRSPLLSMLMAAMGGNKGGLDGISFKADPNDPYAEDFGDTPDKVAVADHWWNKGKADNVNNQIQLAGINAKQSGDINNKEALAQQQLLLPGKLDELKKSGDITNEQHAKLMEALGPIDAKNAALKANAVLPAEATSGNYRTLNGLGYMANPENEKMVNVATTVPNLNRQLAGINAATSTLDTSQLTDDKLRQVIANTMGPDVSKEITNAQTNDLVSKLTLGSAPAEFQNKLNTEAAKLENIKAQTKAYETGALSPLAPGTTMFNKGTMTPAYTAPSKFENAMRIANGVVNTVPAGINMPVQSTNIPPASNTVVPSLPKVNLNPTQNQSSGVSVKNGIPGKIINGVWVPLTPVNR